MLKSAVALCLAVTVLVCGPATADEADESSPETLEELKAAVQKVVEDNGIPAVGIAMVDATGPVWIDAIGEANIEDDIDADENSLFRIGSTSKMFVALAALKLIEEGRLSLDDRLRDLAPDIEFDNPWEETDPVRLVHLLEHTTGWDDIHLPEYAHNDPKPATLKEGLDLHPHSRASRWKPGSRYSYCNAGPAVAAYVLEKVTGQEFEHYVHDNFFEPIGMAHATYRRDRNVEEKGVTSYANGNQPQDYWHIAIRPSGAINASVRDMAAMVGFFLNRGAVGGRQLISRESLERMERAESTTAARAGQEVGYGLNNYSSTYESWVYRAHHGGVNGGITELAYLPQAGVGHAVMINSDDGRGFREITGLVRAFETRGLTRPIVESTENITDRHRAIQGIFYPINSRQQVSYFLDRIFGAQRLWFDDDKLMRKALLGGEIIGYYPRSPTKYAYEETGLISLTKVVDPLAGPVVHAGDLVLKPASPLLVFGQLGVAALWSLSIITSLLFLPVWGFRKLRGKSISGATLRIRVWPLLASLAVCAILGLFALGMAEPFERLGEPSSISVGIMLCTILFATFAALGVSTLIGVRRAPMNRANYWHSGIASLVHAVVAIYLLWFGVIGIMTWA